jgi:hypothetical protein
MEDLEEEDQVMILLAFLVDLEQVAKDLLVVVAKEVEAYVAVEVVVQEPLVPQDQ